MSNKITIIGILVLVAVVAGFVFLSGSNGNTEKTPITGNVVAGETQKIVLSMEDLNYYPNTIRVKEGIPVEITLDSSVVGCLRSFTIKEFGVNQYVKTPNDKIIFTPNKKGTFGFACSMNMARGTIIVE